MLSKILKYIPGFSLWCAWLILTAHLLIPHDHHIADSFSNRDGNCSVPENKSSHNSSFPIHCHAFNDLATDKARPIQISPNIKENSIIFQVYSIQSELELPLSGENIIDLDKPVFNYFALDLSLLRAPPVFV